MTSSWHRVFCQYIQAAAAITNLDACPVTTLQLDPRWQLVRDPQDRLRIKRQLRTKNFTKVSLLLLMMMMMTMICHPDLSQPEGSHALLQCALTALSDACS
jgi:hypothetical protein